MPYQKLREHAICCLELLRVHRPRPLSRVINQRTGAARGSMGFMIRPSRSCEPPSALNRSVARALASRSSLYPFAATTRYCSALRSTPRPPHTPTAAPHPITGAGGAPAAAIAGAGPARAGTKRPARPAAARVCRWPHQGPGIPGKESSNWSKVNSVKR